MSFSGKVRPPAVDTDDAMEATDDPEERRGITPDVRRTGCAPLGDCGIGEDIFRLYIYTLMCMYSRLLCCVVWCVPIPTGFCADSIGPLKLVDLCDGRFRVEKRAQNVPVFVEHVNQHQPPALLQEKIARMPAAGQLYLGTKKYPL